MLPNLEILTLGQDVRGPSTWTSAHSWADSKLSELSAFQSLSHWFIPARSPSSLFIKIVTFSVPSLSFDLLRNDSYHFEKMILAILMRREPLAILSPQGKRSSCCPHYNLSLESSSQPATLKSPHSSGHPGSNGSRSNLFFCILRPKHDRT